MREGAASWGISGVRRLRAAMDFAWRHAASITLGVFLIVGLAVLDDYGVSTDEATQRTIGAASLDYVLGDADALLDDRNRFYGVAFEMPLAAVERIFALEDSRAVYLSRHLLTHLVFLAGGLFAWLLAYRMFGSRALALFAMLLFLLHPRMYAHSFFNTKDIPFLAMFMASLYLIHRAFGRDDDDDGVWAFALCGAGVGVLTNIRVLGVLPFAAVLGMLALDLLSAARRGDGGRRQVRRVLANGAAFCAAALAAVYAAWPLLWDDPLAFATSFSAFSQFAYAEAATLFRGIPVRWPNNIPPEYIPVWIGITTPLAALALALAGAAFAIWEGVRLRRAALANTPARFGLLLVGCMVLPIAAVIALDSNVYNGWRQLYFVYAPACVLAALGLRGLLSLAVLRPMPARAIIIALLGVSAIMVLTQMIALHPHQADYFNQLAGRSERLKTVYQMDYWNTTRREALEWLLAAHPGVPIYLNSDDHNYEIEQNLRILPEDDRRRLRVNVSFPDFIIADDGENPIWTREIYGGAVAAVLDRRGAALADKRETYQSALRTERLADSVFDLYIDGGALIYAKSPCEADDARGRFWLSAFPADESDLSQAARDGGRAHESLNFDFHRYGGMFDGKCVIRRALPDYPIVAVETGQWIPGGERLWTAEFRLE